MGFQSAARPPPRALWVPFMLGRPFGVPNDPTFQRKVLVCLLALFDAVRGPVLEDFAEDAPGDPGDVEGYACPVSFEQSAVRIDDHASDLLAEIALGTLLKRCCDDIKAFYFEAAGAQPGQPSAKAIDQWFWRETAAARAFLRLREIGLGHPDPSAATFVERSLVPRAVAHSLDMPARLGLRRAAR